MNQAMVNSRLPTDCFKTPLTPVSRSHASSESIRPPYVFTTKGSGVHPDHRAVTDIVVNGVFYARLPKWVEVNGAPAALEETEPHEIDRLFFAHCRMERAWSSVDFTVDMSDWLERKRAAIAAYTSVFQG